MDIVDQAQENMEQLAARQERPRPLPATGPEATGYCLNCGLPLPEPRRWCSADCRDDWEWFIRKQKTEDRRQSV
jgi:RNA polymerase-binding transcription factor DksA